MPRLRFIVSAASTVVLLLSTAQVTSATQPGVNGRIAFMRFDEDGRFQIWSANPDLTAQDQLTQGADDGWWPAWSPDATRIAFSSGRTDHDPEDGVDVTDVFTMRPDGSDVRQITDSLGVNEKPSWSPDGRWLVYSADRADYPAKQGIYRIRSDGSGSPERITTLPGGSAWQELPRFSPDGRLIVFTEYRGGSELRNHREGTIVGEQSALFTVRPDGTDLKQLTPWGMHAGDADWSPDGRRIVFGAQPTHIGNVGDIHTMDADGSHIRDVTQDHGLTGIGTWSAFRFDESINPAWSPDGSKIIFLHVSLSEESGWVAGLQTMNSDGSGRAFVSSDLVEGHQPDWGSAPLVD